MEEASYLLTESISLKCHLIQEAFSPLSLCSTQLIAVLQFFSLGGELFWGRDYAFCIHIWMLRRGTNMVPGT